MRAHIRVLGEDARNTLTTMNNLAAVYGKLDRCEEAEQLHLHAMDIQLREFGEENRDTMLSMNNLGGLYRDQGQFEEAEMLFGRAATLAKRHLGNEDAYLIGVFLTRQGSCLAALEHYDKAENALVEAVEVLRTSLGPEHRRTREAIEHLVELYELAGDQEMAAVQRALLTLPGEVDAP